MSKKRLEKGHASFAHPPNKYMIAVNLQDAEAPHRVNAIVRDSRVNVFGQHVDEIKTKDGEVRYNFHGFANEFELPDNVDPDSLTLSVADNQTIIIEGDKLSRRGSARKLSGSQRPLRESRSQPRTYSQTQPSKASRPEDRSENKSGPTSWKTWKEEDLQARRTHPYKPIHETNLPPCEPPTMQWTKSRPVTPPGTPCCPLCCGPV